MDHQEEKETKSYESETEIDDRAKAIVRNLAKFISEISGLYTIPTFCQKEEDIEFIFETEEEGTSNFKKDIFGVGVVEPSPHTMDLVEKASVESLKTFINENKIPEHNRCLVSVCSHPTEGEERKLSFKTALILCTVSH